MVPELLINDKPIQNHPGSCRGTPLSAEAGLDCGRRPQPVLDVTSPLAHFLSPQLLNFSAA